MVFDPSRDSRDGLLAQMRQRIARVCFLRETRDLRGETTGDLDVELDRLSHQAERVELHSAGQLRLPLTARSL